MVWKDFGSDCPWSQHSGHCQAAAHPVPKAARGFEEGFQVGQSSSSAVSMAVMAVNREVMEPQPLQEWKSRVDVALKDT